MKILSKFENYKIPNEKLKLINGADPGGCYTTCDDACFHYYSFDDSEKRSENFQSCQKECEEACKPKAILG